MTIPKKTRDLAKAILGVIGNRKVNACDLATMLDISGYRWIVRPQDRQPSREAKMARIHRVLKLYEGKLFAIQRYVQIYEFTVPNRMHTVEKVKKNAEQQDWNVLDVGSFHSGICSQE